MTVSNPDEMLRLLSDRYRRQILQILRKMPDRDVQLNELIDSLARGTTSNSERTDRIGVQLHHIHLPKLHEHGLIEYDPEAQFVRYHATQTVEAVMENVAENKMNSFADD